MTADLVVVLVKTWIQNHWAQRLKVVSVILLSSYLLIRGIIPAWTELRSDFPTYYVAARMLLTDEDTDRLYDAAFFAEKTTELGTDFRGRFSPFPPSNAFIMLPIAAFEPLAAKRIWTVFNAFLLIWFIYLLHKITTWPLIDCALFILLAGAGLSNNFLYGKVYLLLCCLILYAHLMVLKSKQVLAGILLGLCISLKYFPLVLVIAYALSKKNKLVISSTITVLAVAGIQIMAFGLSVFRDYMEIALIPHLSGLIENVNPYSATFQSWESFLRNVFVYHPILNAHPLFNFATGKVISQFLIFSFFLFLLIMSLRNLADRSPDYRQAMAIALLSMLMLTILPAGATYHFLFLIFPLALFIHENSLQKSKWAVLLISLFAIIGFIPFGYVLGLGKNGISLFLSYPRLWIMTGIFIISSLFMIRKIPKSETDSLLG